MLQLHKNKHFKKAILFYKIMYTAFAMYENNES